MKTLRLLFLLMIINQLSINNCNATITISNVNVTVSTCPNNGTATVFASSTSNTAVFLYNIVAGPVLYPLQNDSIFMSLYPGNYTVRVHDVNSYDSATTTFTITGTYQPLSVTATPVAPLCTGASTGEIIVNPNGTGLGPYTWQITSPTTGTPQSNDTLRNLAAGTYIIKTTDACDNAITQGAVVGAGGSGFAYTQLYINFLGCDTALLEVYFDLNAPFAKLPLEFSFTTSTGTVTKYELPKSAGAGSNVYYMWDTLYNVGFNRYLKICATDTCHLAYCYPGDTVSPFEFPLQFNTTDSNCVQGYSANLIYGGFVATPYILATSYPPLQVTITDTSTNAAVYSTTDFQKTNGLIPVLAGGKTYRLTVRDGCGDAYSTLVYWPATTPPSTVVGNISGGCTDSTGIIGFNWQGFTSAVTIKLLSGPTRAHSTKPGFAYNDTIIYPFTISDVYNGGFYTMGGLPPGTYTYQVIDSCNHTANGFFTINTVSSLQATPTVLRNCGGLNTISEYLGIFNTSFSELTSEVRISQNGKLIDSVLSPATPVFSSLSPGQYVMDIIFFERPDVTLPGLSCWSITDTVNITPINDSILAATDVATCNGVIYIHVDADTMNGVLPFQYEIISGPETFAPQAGNLFTVSTYGTYVVGVIDSCGNVDARQVTVDTGKFTPVVRSGGWCQGSAVQLTETASPFFSYIWKKPGGALYTGDTLVINPFTGVDTGTYLITKIVTINSCRDTAYGSYYLSFKDTFQQSVSLCAGDTLFVGQHIHTASGIYSDTLTGAYGCDSIVVSTLSLHSTGQVTITSTSPPACHTGPTTLSVSGGSTYVWSPGNYQTDTITVNPLVTTVYTVLADENLSCSASASITVNPSTDSVITITKNPAIFCSGDSAQLCAPAGFTTYQWSGGITATGDCVYVTQAGDYYVMASDTNGCTVSSNHLTVYEYPVPSVSIIVLGDTLTTYGQVSYQWIFNGTPIPGATGLVYIARKQGSYSVEEVDTNGCITTSNPVMITGIRDLAAAEDISIYPNPNSAGNWQLTVGNELIGANLDVFDEQGRLVFHSAISNQNSALSFAVPSGVYYLRISNENVSVVRKLVKIN